LLVSFFGHIRDKASQTDNDHTKEPLSPRTTTNKARLTGLLQQRTAFQKPDKVHLQRLVAQGIASSNLLQGVSMHDCVRDKPLEQP
jgi:hypothetical protein